MVLTLAEFSGVSAQQYYDYGRHESFRDWKLDRLFRWKIKGDPFIEFSYGIGNPKHKNLTGDIAEIGSAEIKLGFSRLDEMYDSTIVEMDERFIFVSNLSTKLNSGNPKASELKTEMLRFGLGRRTGYGYDAGGIQILPYHEYGVAWSRLKTENRPWLISSSMTPQEIADNNYIADRYENEFRFGSVAEGGIRLQFSSALSFNAAYEASVIFPRHLVWKHLGSVIIEGAAQSSLEYFIDEVLDSSPAAAPVVNFLLKNGLSYAFFTLYKDRMNWPFKTETPLTHETFKVGVSFVF